MDDAQENVKRTSNRRKQPDDAVAATAARPGAGSARKPASGSGEMRKVAAPPPTASAGVTARRGQPVSVKKKKPPMPVKELIIAGVVVVVLAVTAVVIYVVKKGERDKYDASKRTQEEIFEANIKRGKDAMEKAIKAGTLFVIGKTEAGFDEASLFTPFKGDSKIYNVIYDHGSKDKRQNEKHDTKKLIDDPEHYTISMLNKQKEYPPDLNVTYGFAKGKELPVVIAKKTLKANKDDVVNTGGVITVVVLADEDDFFKKARQVELPKVEEKKPAATEAKPAESRTAAPEEKK